MPAIGMEMIGGRYIALHGSDLKQSMIAIAEEAMEMYGASFFVYAVLRHLADEQARIQLRFRA